MRRLVSHLIMTLDGVTEFDAVQDTIISLRDTPEVLSDFRARLAEEDAMVLGRVSYQQWADHWPTADAQPFADHINTVAKYVVSSTLDHAPWGAGEATVLSGDLVAEIRGLKQQPGRAIGVHASPRLVDGLLRAGLLDELRLEIYPVVAGSGSRLFTDGRPSQQLRLVRASVTGNGVIIASYGPRWGP